MSFDYYDVATVKDLNLLISDYFLINILAPSQGKTAISGGCLVINLCLYYISVGLFNSLLPILLDGLMLLAIPQFVRAELTTAIAYFKIWGKFNIDFEVSLGTESFVQSNFEIFSIFYIAGLRYIKNIPRITFFTF